MFEALLKDEPASEHWDTFFVVDDHWPAQGCLETYEVHAKPCSSTHTAHSNMVVIAHNLAL